MDDTKEPEVVFSALCLHEKETYAPTGDPPALIEVARVTYEPRLMSPKEMKDAADKFTKSIGLLKALLGFGQSALKFLKDEDTQKLWSDRLKVIAGVGDILKGILKFVPGPPNPMIEELQKLADTVGDLEKKISANFDEMKMFISEVNFFVKIMSPTVVLSKFMHDCIKNPGIQTHQNFKRAYAKHPPLKLAYKLKSYLEQNNTNPLKVAMDLEQPKTTATFNKWEEIICCVLSQFLVLESFATGLLEIKGQFIWDRLFAATNSVVDSIAQWKEKYKKDEHSNWLYWD